MIPVTVVVWVVPLIAVGTVIGVGYYTVQVVKKLEEWKDGPHARLHARVEDRLVKLETADAIRRDREDRE
jgi:heme/copper-type cytochrome/quinol oxidase subunit 2